MAAALAASILPGTAVQSAGLVPGDAIAEKAISIVKEMTGADISDHRPRDLADADLTAFDRIVVLDRRVAEDLRIALPPKATLLEWDVQDPYCGSLDDYRRCAEELRTHIEKLAID